MNSKVLHVLLVDVGQSMRPRLDEVSSGLHSFIHSRIIHKPKDEIAVVLFGSNGTYNELHSEAEAAGEEESGQYQNIYTLSPMQAPTMGMLRTCLDLKPLSGDGPADYLDAITVGIDLLLKVPRKAASRRLVVVSDMWSEVDVDEEFKLSLLQQMQFQKIDLEVLTVSSASGDDPPPCWVNNRAVFESMLAGLEESRSFMRAFNEAEEDWTHRAGKREKGAPLQPLSTLYRGELMLGPAMGVKVWVYKKTGEERFPTLKKYSASLPADDPDATHEVKRETVYRSSVDPEDDDVGPERRVAGWKFGRQRVPVSPEMQAFLQFNVDKGMNLVGFTPRANIPRHYFMKDASILVPHPPAKGPQDKAGLSPANAAKAAKCVSALARAMERTGQCAVVRACFRANSHNVTWGVLTPHLVQGRQDSLLLNIIPFSEDIRDFTFDSFFNADEKVQPNCSQLSAAEDLITSMDLTPPHVSTPGGADPFPLDGQTNPALARFHSFLKVKAVDPDAGPPPAETFITTSPLPPHTTLQPRQAFQASFPVESGWGGGGSGVKRSREEDGKEEKEGADGRQGKTSRRELAAEGEGEESEETTQVAQPDVSANISIQALSASAVSKVSSQTPLEDFRVLLQRQDGPQGQEGWTAKAMQQMADLILRSNTPTTGGSDGESSAVLAVGTTVECIRALREACVATGLNPTVYNDLMRTLFSDQESRRAVPQLWGLVVKRADLTLISNSEVSSSSVTIEESASFFQESTSTEPISVEISADADDDEFDDME